jgi:hypothetical protein
MENLITICFVIVWLKAITIGSDFNFILWIKYGKLYTNWYNNRPTFKDFMK